MTRDHEGTLYSYDHQDRLTSIDTGSSVYELLYNGLGDRLQQTVDGAGTTYALDLNAGLTQVLSDGTNAYLYGLGRIGELQPSGWAYHLPDALGSVRQLADAAGVVALARSYEPFGSPLDTAGQVATSYGFTGEWTDATGMLYLRTRYYRPREGRFLTKDNSALENNLFLYASADPVNRTDPTGLMSGFEAFGLCFYIHTMSQYIPNFIRGELFDLQEICAQQAVDICKLAYSKDAWSSMPFGDAPNSAHNLLGIFINETSEDERLKFNAEDVLTNELASSHSLTKLRREYLQFGETSIPKELRFNEREFLECWFDYSPWLGWSSALSLPLTCFMGSFYYQMKAVETDTGTYVGFRIDNRTDLASGSHIPSRFPRSHEILSVENLIDQKLITGDEPILDVMNMRFGEGQRRVVSILSARSIDDTGWYESYLGYHELGGGNLIQTFVWMEKYDPCDDWSWFRFYMGWSKVEAWPYWYPPITQPITEWGETY